MCYHSFEVDTAENTTPPESARADVVTKITKPQRESGLELLRIIAMLLIVLHHVYYWGWLAANPTAEEGIFGLFCRQIGKFGVNVFVLISGYFMVNKRFKLTRVLNIVLQTTFYTFVIYLFFTLFGKVQFTWKGLIFSILPVLYEQYWFVTMYVILLLLSPILNLILHTFNQKTLGLGLLGLLAYTILFPYFSKILIGEFFESAFYNQIIFWIELYCVGGYLQLHGIKLPKMWVVIIMVVSIIYGIMIACFDGEREIRSVTSWSNFAVAVGLLLIFKDFKFQSRIINTIATTTFGIYLLHENSYVRDWVYGFCQRTLFSSVSSPVLWVVLSTLTIFTVCMVIDFLRQQTIHRATNRFLQYVDQKLAQRKQQNVKPTQSTDTSND